MKISMILEKTRAPSGSKFHKGLVMGTALLSHEQMHDPSEKKNERRLQNGHRDSFRDFLAEALLFFLAVVRLVGEVAHHHGDADCRNDVKCGCTEGRNHEPSPQHAQGVAVEDGTEDHQEPDPDNTAENSQCSHVFLLKVLNYHDSLVAGCIGFQDSCQYSDPAKNSILWAISQAQTKNHHFCCFYGLNLMDSWIKKFSSPKMRNREFVFAPKIEYELVAELAPPAGGAGEANPSNLQFPTWCAQ